MTHLLMFFLGVFVAFAILAIKIAYDIWRMP